MRITKIELGGGIKPLGMRHVNIDMSDNADLKVNLDEYKLPFEDNQIESVYSAHTLEHLARPNKMMQEILRVCKIGALIELHLPHWTHPHAMVETHRCVVSDRVIHNWLTQPEEYWCHTGKALQLVKDIHYEPEVGLIDAMQAFPHASKDFLLKTYPNCCHEIHVSLKVIEYKYEKTQSLIYSNLDSEKCS